jgi:hypothetical protein
VQLFVKNNQPPNKAFDGCVLRGIPLSGDRYLSNLGMTSMEIRQEGMTSLIRCRVDYTSVHRDSIVAVSDMEVGTEKGRRGTKVCLG